VAKKTQRLSARSVATISKPGYHADGDGLYLIVDKSNTSAIHVYEKCGFRHEAELIEEFFGNGSYHNALRMCMFQDEFFKMNQQVR